MNSQALGSGHGVTLPRLRAVVHDHRASTPDLSITRWVTPDQKRTPKEAQRNLQLEKDRSESLLLNILPASIVEELKRAGATRPVLFESATVLFTDFVGFSKTAGLMEPAELVQQRDDYFTAFDEIIAANGLEKLKTIGDAYMCAGGLLQSNDTHALDCRRAALAMQRRAAQIGEEKRAAGHPAWGLRVGINTGVVVAGVVGKKKFAYDVWGDAVNLAARLESAGEPGRVNVSASTWALVSDHFAGEARGQLKVKNMGEVEMFFLA